MMTKKKSRWPSISTKVRCRLLLCYLVLQMAWVSSGLRAEESLIRMPDQTGNWKIDLQFGKVSPTALSDLLKANPDVKVISSIEVALNKNIRRDRIKWMDGSVSEMWKINGRWISLDADGNVHLQSGTSMMGHSSPMTWLAFEPAELEQLTKDAAVSSGDYDKKQPSIIYEVNKKLALGPAPPIGPGAGADSGVKAGPMEITLHTLAWVDSETCRPLAIKDGEITYVFHFLDSPPEQLSPPQACLDELERYKQPSETVSPSPKHN